MTPRCACGGDWFAVRPGTAPDATIYPKPPVVAAPDGPVAAEPMAAWCFACWRRVFMTEAAA